MTDNWAMAPLTESERRDFWEICEDRYQVHSTILTSQLPVSRWHEQIGDPTLADGILDRLVHNAHRIKMRGDFDAQESRQDELVSQPPGVGVMYSAADTSRSSPRRLWWLTWARMVRSAPRSMRSWMKSGFTWPRAWKIGV